jgi:hypothetical protein
MIVLLETPVDEATVYAQRAHGAGHSKGWAGES